MSTTLIPSPKPGTIDLFTPKLVSALREGYGFAALRRDAIAGLTVAIVALPLAMAIGIASGSTPDRGLLTAIVAGFLISAFGGSRFQIGGPTAAFIVVVYQTIERHGFDGLVLATFIAGVILLVLGLLRLGTYIKYIPYPVVVGFTAGIAVSIFASQVKELLGLDVSLPGEFIPKAIAIAEAIGGFKPAALFVAILSFGIIIGLKLLRPKWPGFLIAVVATSVIVTLVGVDVATIGSAFGGVPRTLPLPTLPDFDLGKVQAVMPDAITIALLAGIESLLSAVVADGMTGRRHRSNCELVAQGIANLGSSLIGGLPATGAIARTATNIRAGGRTPVAGILHAVFLLGFVLVAAPILSYVPLAALAAILAYVAWNIGEFGHIRQILTTAPLGDRAVLVVTFLLTVLFDLTVAIEVGVVLAAFLFMHRMAELVEVDADTRFVERDVADDAPRDHALFEAAAVPRRRSIVYRINGPFFFGATQKFSSVIEQIGEKPEAYILDFSGVPMIDSTAAGTLRSLVENAHGHGAEVFVAGLTPRLRLALRKLHIGSPDVHFAPDVETAVARAEAGGTRHAV
jgi:SulP family sulfate permease